MRKYDLIAVKKVGDGRFLAVHIHQDEDREQDDCETFLFKCGWVDHSDDEIAAVAARRLVLEHTNSLQICKNEMYWCGGWRMFPLE